jgi:hypothetical protein
LDTIGSSYLTIIGGQLKQSYTNYSTTQLIGSLDQIIYVTASSNWALTLPTVSSSQNRVITIIKTDNNGNSITVTASTLAGQDYINGSTTKVINTQYQILKIQATTGNNWYIIQ